MLLLIHASESNEIDRSVPRARWLVVAERVLTNRLAMIGIGIFVILILAAIFAPYLTPYDPLKRDVTARLSPPSSAHWLGTDPLGRDLWTRILYGGRISLYVGLTSVLLGLVIGVPLGMVAGYFGGFVDAIIMRLLDMILAFPGIIFAIWLVAMLGPGISQIILANAFYSLPLFARLVRGSVLSVKHSDYVLASQTLGIGNLRILTNHILPNVLPAIIVVASLSIAGAMLTGAALGYLGLGARPPAPEWGTMLADGRQYLRTSWWVAVFPGAVLTLVVLASMVLGDALRDILDPHTLRRQQ